jgi:predicted ribosome quality control (RQC) complex YloA/Tae2 family protein
VDNFYLSALVQELSSEVQGHTIARVSLESSTLLIDLRLASGCQLLASLDRTTPALYLSNKVAAATKKPSSTFFLSLLRKHIVGARVVKIWKEPLDRIVHIDFEKLDAGDNQIRISLCLYLTGRSANACLTDATGVAIGMLFEDTAAERLAHAGSSTKGLDPANLTGDLDKSITESDLLAQVFGPRSLFGPQLRNEFLARSKTTSPADALRSLIEDLFHRNPLALVYSKLPLDQVRRVVIDSRKDLLLSHIELVQAQAILRYQFSSLSEAADEFYDARGHALALRSAHAALQQTLTREITRRVSVLTAIESDRSRFGQPEKLKRSGDLLLANLKNARIEGNTATVIDYYDPSQAEIQIEIPEGATLQEAASDYFGRYQKARRALAAIASRELEISKNLGPFTQLLLKLKHEPTAECVAEVGTSLDQIRRITSPTGSVKDKRARDKTGFAFGRRFKSTDGYEIVVGRNDRDNDALTFRIAKPHDIWLHAADYPGSHAIIRNPRRETPPNRTIIEAAEVAAFYSQAKREGKAAVHYTQKKFVSKPPRSKPGLVRLSSFKTILVEPRCNLERLS